MRLGISSYTYTWAVGGPGYAPAHPMTATGLLERAAGLGVGVVQIADNLPLDRLSGLELSTLARRAAELGIDIEVGTRGIAHDHLQSYLRLAQQMRSPILRVVIDTADHRPSIAEVIDRVKAIIPEFERAGVCLAIENHDRFPARALVHIIEEVGSAQVGICLDMGNSFGVMEGPEVVLAALGAWAVNLHVKDFVVRRASHNLGFVIEGRPAGQGQLDIPWVLESLRNLGRDPNAILELWTPPEDTLEGTIAKESGWATASVEYLRQLVPD
jgi:sugar phosphate isomerase/epimerase